MANKFMKIGEFGKQDLMRNQEKREINIQEVIWKQFVQEWGEIKIVGGSPPP